MNDNHDIALKPYGSGGDLFIASRGATVLGRVYQCEDGTLYARRQNGVVGKFFNDAEGALAYLSTGERRIPGLTAAKSVLSAALPRPHILFRSAVLLSASAGCYAVAPLIGGWAETAGLVALVVAVNQILATSILLGIDDVYRIVAERFGFPAKNAGQEL